MKEKITKLTSIKELKQKKIKSKFKRVYNIHKSSGKTKKRPIIKQEETTTTTKNHNTKKQPIILND